MSENNNLDDILKDYTANKTTEETTTEEVKTEVENTEIVVNEPEIVINTSTTSNNEQTTDAFVKTETRNDYIRSLLEKYNYSIEEAEKMADKRFNKDGSLRNSNNGFNLVDNSATDSLEEENKSTEETTKEGDVITVKVPADDAERINFTEDEKEKLVNARAIKLVRIKDEKLATINVKRVSSKEKVSILRNFTSTISKYAVPLQCAGDFASFKGSQTMLLVTNALNEDDNLYQELQKKAALLYDKYLEGTVLKKFDSDGNIILPYTDFLNKYKYYDLEMGLFGIFVASSTEKMQRKMTCEACGHGFDLTYNIKQLLKMDNIDESFKERIDNILSHKQDELYLKRLNDESSEVIRFESPVTRNIYDLRSPSVAKALRVFQKVDYSDLVMVYLSAILMPLETIYVPNEDTEGEYILIGYDPEKEEALANAKKDSEKEKISKNYSPLDELFDNIHEIPEVDLQLIQKEIQRMFMPIAFRLDSVCPSCGAEIKVPFTMNELVFRLAQDSVTAIE